ncbi:MAG: serine--tRNA ligase, partial [Bacteroidota bacterium]
MLLVSYIRENREKVLAGLAVRGIKDASNQIDEIINLDDKRKQLQQQNDNILAQSNAIAKSIGQLFREGKQDEANEKKKETAELKSQTKTLSEELKNVEADLQKALYDVPNIPNAKVPAGNSEQDNIVAKEVGKKPTLHDGAKPHWELIEDYD